jgi:putative ABC transport system substrate-binding protein
MKRIGALFGFSMNDPVGSARLTAFLQGLQELGWTVGRNVQVEYRWDATDAERTRKGASDLVALAPDVILVNTGVNTGILLQATRTLPIVFVTAIDPVGAGLVASLARPGGNATGFASAEFSLGAKYLELLKEIAPRLTRVAVLRDPSVPAGSAPFGAIQGAAPSLRVEVVPIDTRDAGELERGITAFAQTPNGGLILAAAFFGRISRDLIISLAARHRLPAVYPASVFGRPTGAGADTIRDRAQYEDREGARPSNTGPRAGAR